MSDLKGVMKNGWHPKGKDGGKESWRGDFKGINQVAGWMGKGKTSDIQGAQQHVSRPLATLKDPSSFGPPPKNVNYHGGAALPNEITPHRGGLGAPLTQREIDSAAQAAATPASEEEEEPVEAKKPPPPALPYRADRTGLSTANLPPPPVHHHIAESSSARPTPPPPPARSSHPSLPPRLPARQNTRSPVTIDPTPTTSEIPPPTREPGTTPKPTSISYLNNTATIGRLGKAGINVPGLGIGTSSKTEANPWASEKSKAGSGSSSSTSNSNIAANGFSGLQSRFSRMNTSSPASSTTQDSTTTQPPPPSNTAPPSWKQSQSAFTTAQNFHKDPASITLADAQSAAQTANQARVSGNAFREKHADSIAKSQQKAKALDQKYKVTSKINKFLDEHTDPDPEPQQQQQHQPVQPIQQPVQQPIQPTQYSQATSTPLPPPTWSSAVPQHAQTTAYQPVQSPPLPSTAAAAAQEPSTTAHTSIHRKPPPPPPPSKPQNLKGPPPVPMGTRPSLG